MLFTSTRTESKLTPQMWFLLEAFTSPPKVSRNKTRLRALLRTRRYRTSSFLSWFRTTWRDGGPWYCLTIIKTLFKIGSGLFVYRQRVWCLRTSTCEAHSSAKGSFQQFINARTRTLRRSWLWNWWTSLNLIWCKCPSSEKSFKSSKW